MDVEVKDEVVKQEDEAVDVEDEEAEEEEHNRESSSPLIRRLTNSNSIILLLLIHHCQLLISETPTEVLDRTSLTVSFAMGLTTPKDVQTARQCHHRRKLDLFCKLEFALTVYEEITRYTNAQML